MKSHFDQSILSSFKLIDCIVNLSDFKALHELLINRKLFYYKNKQLVLSEFVWQLREKLSKNPGSKKLVIDEIVDETYDLTLSKFINLPAKIIDSSGFDKNNIESVKPKQVDCRNYYRPIVKIIKEWRGKNPNASELEEEMLVGTILQKLVVKHFYLSRKECLRKNRPFSVRYDWKTGGKIITLWYPIEIGPKLLKEWLKKRIKKSDLNDSGLGARLQSEIDRSFFVGRRVDLDNKFIESGPRTDPDNGLDTSDINHNLANIVAAEKVNNIENLRPSIQSLGKEILGQLIQRIFRDLADEIFEDIKIAKDFGISKATFSRFAGSHWQKRLEHDKEVVIPDLWKNTAKIIASDSIFIEAASEAGVMKNITKVLSITKDGQ